MNAEGEEKPPSISDSQRVHSSIGDNRVNPCDYNWVPLWRRGLLPSVDFNRNIGIDSLYQHKIVDMDA